MQSFAYTTQFSSSSSSSGLTETTSNYSDPSPRADENEKRISVVSAFDGINNRKSSYSNDSDRRLVLRSPGILQQAIIKKSDEQNEWIEEAPPFKPVPNTWTAYVYHIMFIPMIHGIAQGLGAAIASWILGKIRGTSGIRLLPPPSSSTAAVVRENVDTGNNTAYS